ncbi:MAG: hypothetical protein PHP50_07710 [Lachnospiraceae bacterium]|nr:hypothetical protein [Lachnospiraceae bacterium]
MAAAPLENETKNVTWLWWLLLVAVAAVTGKVSYDKYQQKKADR